MWTKQYQKQCGGIQMVNNTRTKNNKKETTTEQHLQNHR
jgi:hypothetical protein